MKDNNSLYPLDILIKCNSFLGIIKMQIFVLIIFLCGDATFVLIIFFERNKMVDMSHHIAC